MKTRTVSRTEFTEHIKNLARKVTEEPATLWLATNAMSAATGESYGRGSISFFIEKSQWGSVAVVNDTARGMKTSYFAPELRPDDWTGFEAIFDEEEQIAAEKGSAVEYTIGGQAHDRFALEKRLSREAE